MAEFLGGKKATAPKMPPIEGEESSTSSEDYSHDAMADRMRKQREDSIAYELARQIRQIDDNIRRLDETIKQLEKDRNPSPMMGALRSARDENVRKKVQLTNGSQLQDAVDVGSGETEDIATINIVLDDDEKGASNNNKVQYHNTFLYEELFTDQENGETILTFPDEVIALLGLKEGDDLALSTQNGSLIIKKI